MLQAVIFDKDGTLFDFTKSWGAWTRRLLAQLAGGDAAALARLANVAGYDLDRAVFRPDSVVIANPMPDIAAALQAALPGSSLEAIERQMAEVSMQVAQVPAVPLAEVLGALKASGLVLGLATNDTEAPARAHLAAAGVLDLFSFVAGCDSGWGGKPAPGQLLAFVRAHDLDPARVAMVGDSRHDLHAARAAGMKAVAVLTGIATASDLVPDADVVLPDITGLAEWIAGLPRTVAAG